jgi:hypothetical protein
MMDMHKGYAYQIYNFDFQKKLTKVKPINLTSQNKTNMNKTQNPTQSNLWGN